jgi:dihydroorotase-like cyclic amidohydrolase
MVVVEPSRDEVVTPRRAGSRSDFALHEGKHLIGWPSLVIKGGMPVASDGDRVTSRGEYLPRHIDSLKRRE